MIDTTNALKKSNYPTKNKKDLTTETCSILMV